MLIHKLIESGNGVEKFAYISEGLHRRINGCALKTHKYG
jgi:hypothetical protein